MNGFAGNDTLTIDDSNGLINTDWTGPGPIEGIHYDGGTGNNNLQLLQTGGPTQTSDTYSVIANPGQGSDVIVGAMGTQTVNFDNLAPVYDNVPAPLTVVGTPSNNTINYEAGPNSGNPLAPYNGDSTALVTVNNSEALEFSHKTTLTLEGSNGNDTFAINNTTTPTGLTAISVDGQIGNNTLVVDANNNPVLSSDVTSTTVTIPVATPIPMGYTNIAQVRVINATDALASTGLVIKPTEGLPISNALVATFNFTDPVPPPVFGNAADFTATINWGDGSTHNRRQDRSDKSPTPPAKSPSRSTARTPTPRRDRKLSRWRSRTSVAPVPSPPPAASPPKSSTTPAPPQPRPARQPSSTHP